MREVGRTCVDDLPEHGVRSLSAVPVRACHRCVRGGVRGQVGLERVPEEHGGGGRGEDGENVGLDGVEGGGGGRERVGGDAGPAREVVGDGLGGLDERVVDDDAGGVVDEADAGELLAAFCETLW